MSEEIEVTPFNEYKARLRITKAFVVSAGPLAKKLNADKTTIRELHDLRATLAFAIGKLDKALDYAILEDSPVMYQKIIHINC